MKVAKVRASLVIWLLLTVGPAISCQEHVSTWNHRPLSGADQRILFKSLTALFLLSIPGSPIAMEHGMCRMLAVSMGPLSIISLHAKRYAPNRVILFALATF